MTTDPNSRQVGGDHYARNGMQHWDLAALADAGYFAGQVTKYTERHSKKNGRQDLEKALHFAEKMHALNTETYGEGDRDGWGRPRSFFRRMEQRSQRRAISPEVIQAIRDYAVDSGLTAIQERIFELCFVQPHKTDDIVSLCKKHLDREYGPTVVQPDPPNMRERVPIPTFQIGEGTEGIDYSHAPSQSSLPLRDPREEYRPGTPEDGGQHGGAVNITIDQEAIPADVEEALTRDLQTLIDEQQRTAEVVAPFKPQRGIKKQRG